MNKHKLYIFFMLPAFLLGGCTKDHGNYSYTELNSVLISGFESNYLLNMLDTLIIEPELEGSIGPLGLESDYEYLWTIYTVAGHHADTISKERNLEYIVTNVPGSYRISYRVKPKDTGISYRQQINLTVMTELQTGFMTLSEVDGQANVTFINVMNNVFEDLYYNINGEYAGTNPVAIRWTMEAPNDYVAIICNDERGGVYASALSFTHMFDYIDWFYEAPEVINPQAYHVRSNQSYLVNNNKLHYRDRNYNIFQDGQTIRVESKFYAAYSGDYEVSPVYVRNNIYYCAKHQRFLYIPVMTQPNIYVTASDPENPHFDPADVGLELIYAKPTRSPRGVFDMDAIFKDAEGGRYYLKYNYNNPASISPIKKEIIPGDYHINHATTFTSNFEEDFFYFGSGSKVYVFDPLIDEERVVYDFGGTHVVDDLWWNIYQPSVREMYVSISVPGQAGKNGSIYHMQVAANGNLSILHAYENVCGKVVSSAWKN